MSDLLICVVICVSFLQARDRNYNSYWSSIFDRNNKPRRGKERLLCYRPPDPFHKLSMKNCNLLYITTTCGLTCKIRYSLMPIYFVLNHYLIKLRMWMTIRKIKMNILFAEKLIRINICINIRMFIKEHNIKMDILLAEKLIRINIWINIIICMKEHKITMHIRLAEKVRKINI